MKKLYLVLSILVLIAAGSYCRLVSPDRISHPPKSEETVRLSTEEAEWDRSARLLLQLRSNTYAASALSHTRHTQAYNQDGYSRFVALCYALFGYHDTLPLHQISLIQRALDILTGLLLYAAVFLMWGMPIPAWLIAAVYMIHPAFRSVPDMLAAEPLNGFLQIGILCCFLLFFGCGKNSKLVGLACGLTLGFGTLLYPPVWAFLLVFTGAAGIRCFYTRRYVGPYLLAIAGFILVLAPWWLQLAHTEPVPGIIIAGRWR